MSAAEVLVRIYIVRHGETKENKLGIMQGQLDTKLHATGVKQARLTADALERIPFQKAFTSDLDRAVKTAEIILQKHPGVTLEKQADLRERYLGDWEGQKIEGRGPNPPSNLENQEDFNQRAARWWSSTIAALAESLRSDPTYREAALPVNVLVVSHGGYISRLVANMLKSRELRRTEGLLFDGKCWNASISVIDVLQSGEAMLVTFSDRTHLKVDLVQANADVVDD